MKINSKKMTKQTLAGHNSDRCQRLKTPPELGMVKGLWLLIVPCVLPQFPPYLEELIALSILSFLVHE